MTRKQKKLTLGKVIVMQGVRGVIVKIITKIKWTYYDVVFEDAEYSISDWGINGIEFETFREDKLNDKKTSKF